ncbi:MAG: phosphoglycerate dehydrogenase [Verrucomicrobia bacterium]|nr:phosphoglycerate dehydrogenase [Verrucomicrobiota bacterium]
MSWKILITARACEQVGQPAFELLRKAGGEIILSPKFGPLGAEDLLSVLGGADAVLASSDKYSAAVLESPAAARLKIISRWGVGYDSIDLAAAARLGIVTAFTPGMLDGAVADYAFAMLFALARRVHEGHLSMRGGAWTVSWGHDVSGKTLGIIGCGRIGQAVAQRASGFNMKLLGHDVAPNPAAEKLGVKFVPLDQLLAESDFVSLHAALTPQTRGLIGAAQLRRMKPSSYLINTARGAMVDEAALVRALEQGWIAGAALDAFSAEPLPADHPLRKVPNVLLTPHQAFNGRETGERVSLAAAQAIVDLMSGRKPQFVVDPKVFESPSLRAKLR